jgi:signal transduction histidine kinase
MRKQFSLGDYRSERLDLSAVLAHAAEPGVISIDPARRIVGWNATAERLTHVAAATALGAGTDVLPEALREVVDETFRSGQAVTDRALVLPGPARGKTIVFASTLLVRGVAEAPTAVLVILHDLTAAREFELKTERLQRLASLGVLSAGVAHEVKNALVAIKSFAEWLLEKGDAENEMVNLVVQEVNRINTLVLQLLKLAGPAKSTFTEVAVHDSIENALRLVKHQLRNRSIELTVSLEAGCDRVRGDPRQLEQAFINLLLNAIEAMGETGQLTVATEVVFATELVSKFEPRSRRQQLQITIRDTGAGMPSHVLEKLYVPFRTTKPGGTGLGLVITRRIVLAHVGKLTVESEPGRGTTFRITLPLIRSTSQDGTDRSPSRGPGAGPRAQP